MSKDDNMNIYDLEQILFIGPQKQRQKALAKRQILKNDSSITEDAVKELLEDESLVEEKVIECIKDDLTDFQKVIYEIETENDLQVKVQKMEGLLFDLKLRIPDILELLKSLRLK